MKLHLNDRQKQDLAILLLTAIREDCPNLPKANYDYLGYPLSTRMLEQLSYQDSDKYFACAQQLLAAVGTGSIQALEVLWKN